MPAPLSRDINQEFMVSFARWLKRKLAARGSSQAEVARGTGLNPKYLSRVLLAKWMVSRAMAERIGDHFEDRAGALLAAGYLPFPGWEDVNRARRQA